MNALVVYDTQYGNTERIAHAIVDELGRFGPARAIRAAEASPQEMAGVDLLVAGSPTQGWRPTVAMQSFLGRLDPGSLNGMATASFDTRFQAPRLLTGSAARSLASALRRAGAQLLLPPESFFVAGTQGPLKEGELERVATWARTVQERYAAAQAR